MSESQNLELKFRALCAAEGISFEAALELLKAKYYAVPDQSAKISEVGCVQRNSWRLNPRLNRMNEELKELESEGRIQQVARGEWSRPIWTPRRSTDNTEIATHIQSLQIPHENMETFPLIIFYKLGSFQHDPTLRKRIDGIFSPLHNTGEWSRPIWTPTRNRGNSEVISHIQSLRIPLGVKRHFPLVILYKLGSFQHDPILRKRLDSIFSPLHNTFLVNTSGSGKTRLLYEGLCLHWGLFFTCAIDSSSTGPSDLRPVVNCMGDYSRWTEYLDSSDVNAALLLETNRSLVYRASTETLLSRLLVFKMYLEACQKVGLCHDHRQRWLESQIFPSNLIEFPDPFDTIRRGLNTACLDHSALDVAIVYTLQDVQSLLEMSPGEIFYIAIDEANVGSRKYLDAFYDEYGSYPILKEILRAWKQRLGHLPVRFVIAGTVIPEEYFQSKFGEWDDFHWCSDTGSFNDSESQRRYISQFLPPSLKTSITGQALLDRMWQWLQGRHRYTASFLTVLLDRSFESPHTLLGSYVGRLSEYRPHDNEEYTAGEEACYNHWYGAIGCKGLKQMSISFFEVYRAVVSFLTTSSGITDCTTTNRILITEDYGYFSDTSCSQIALDEPITVTYGAAWLKTSKHHVTSFYNFNYHTLGGEILHSHFALFLALSFAPFFDGFSNVSDAFTISGLSAPLPMAKLVTFTKGSEGLEAVDVHFTEDTPSQLVLVAKTPEEVLSWFKHERNEPFCVLPFSSTSSITLVFCLQLSDGRSFWVFVQVPSKFLVYDASGFARDVEEIHPNKLFNDQPEIPPILKELPNPCLDVGPLGVLRVSGSFWVNKAPKDCLPLEQLPAAILNVDSLHEAGKKISQDMLMRRLSRIIASRNPATTLSSSTALLVSTASPKQLGKETAAGENDSGSTEDYLPESPSSPVQAIQLKATKRDREPSSDTADSTEFVVKPSGSSPTAVEDNTSPKRKASKRMRPTTTVDLAEGSATNGPKTRAQTKAESIDAVSNSVSTKSTSKARSGGGSSTAPSLTPLPKKQ